MTDLRIDYGRADMERRLKILEMAGGNLSRAMELERWVQAGFTMPGDAPDTQIAEKMERIRNSRLPAPFGEP